MYLVDSDWLVDSLNEVTPALVLLESLMPFGLQMSIVTYIELMEGVLVSKDQAAARSRLMNLVAAIEVLPLSPAVAERCARIRADLRAAADGCGSGRLTW